MQRFIFALAFVALGFSNAEGVRLLPFPESTPRSASLVQAHELSGDYNQTIKPGRTSKAQFAKYKALDSAQTPSVIIVASLSNGPDLPDPFRGSGHVASTPDLSSGTTRGPPSAS